MASLPLHDFRVRRSEMMVNRIHIFMHGIALLALIFYRATSLFRLIKTRQTPVVPYLLIFISELILSFLWILHRPSRWKPIKRTTYPEGLPEDEKLPRIDVFICTADPSKEPSIGVMNTVISAMALDYPADKLAVYLSDDGGSYVTLQAMKHAWKFAVLWIPFCKKYELKVRCPEAYFLTAESVYGELVNSVEFLTEQKKIEEKYYEFKEILEKNSINASSSVSRDHPPKIEVIGCGNGDTEESMPLLVYVAREKRPSHTHHFKAGSLNALLRVSAILSNAKYFLILDCDHYCNDPTSARQAMCYYLDPEISPKLGWVQFPQHFHNMSDHDIYDGRLQYFNRQLIGIDGLRGPFICGCNFYMTREAPYGTEKIQIDVDIKKVKKSFGSSNEFIKSVFRLNKQKSISNENISDEMQKDMDLVASCTYENDSEWGKEVGYRYFSVVEDARTSLILHCKGWISVWVDPTRKCFQGLCPTNLNETLVQQTRWSLGLMQIAMSKVSPLIYAPLRMSPAQSMMYAALTLDPLYTFPFYGFALIPQICLFYGVPLYPKVSDQFFVIFAFIFASSQLKHLHEVICYGDSFMTWVYEQRFWMMKSGACYFYATINAFLDKVGLNEANFSLTDKGIMDNEQEKRYHNGIYDFQVSPRLLTPLCTLFLVSVAALIVGIARIFWFCNSSGSDALLAQTVISLFGVILNYHIFEGMVFRQDKGRISPAVSLNSLAISSLVLTLGYVLLY